MTGSPTIGHRQAQLTGGRLARADLIIDRTVSGAMMRQRDTALIVMRDIGLSESNLQIDDRLDEYDHVGVMAGHTADISFALPPPLGIITIPRLSQPEGSHDHHPTLELSLRPGTLNA